MKTLRNLALAGTLAIAAVISGGAANAAPAAALEIGLGAPVTAESAITPVHHHHNGGLCYVPFFKLVEWFGYFEARAIKYRCYYNYYYYYNYYNYYNYYYY